MSSKMVWSRFQSIGKCGKVNKLRIQDLPLVRINEALDLFMKYFVREEPLYNAFDLIRTSPEAVKNITAYFRHVFHDPSCQKVICCSDDSDDVGDIMGVSVIRLYTEATHASIESQYLNMLNSPEKLDVNRLKYIEMSYELHTSFNPMKEYKLDTYYGDVGAVIAPGYRKLGIISQFSKSRINICAAHKVPMTGGWMTAEPIQRAGDLLGWETVREIPYDYLAKKYGVKFINTPPTLKFLIARPNTTS